LGEIGLLGKGRFQIMLGESLVRGGLDLLDEATVRAGQRAVAGSKATLAPHCLQGNMRSAPGAAVITAV